MAITVRERWIGNESNAMMRKAFSARSPATLAELVDPKRRGQSRMNMRGPNSERKLCIRRGWNEAVLVAKLVRTAANTDSMTGTE